MESISGPALSHWTELKTDAGRVITLNLAGKTDGQQQFIISLSGPGVKTASDWTVPQVMLREAGKQRGTLLVVPEQGMRLQAATREGVTQLDPQKSGVRQKGVLAFRILETPWKLALDIEQVDPWIQVTSLQHAAGQRGAGEGHREFAVSNREHRPEGVPRFHPDQRGRRDVPGRSSGGFSRGGRRGDERFAGLGSETAPARHRPIFVAGELSDPGRRARPGETVLRGVLAADVNLQRGFVTVQSAGRLQVRVDDLPASLQPTEWQGIPRALQKDLSAAAANFAYRLVEPDFQLPLKLERHEAAKLLPARVNNVTFTSVISDAGVMLTQARLEILPGDKRLLQLTLPAGANFWFAFVNQNGVWPWREGDKILIPLEQQSRGDQPVPVEIYFSSDAGKAAGGALDLNLLAPKFDLPLENLTWRVFLNDKWQVKKWSGALQLAAAGNRGRRRHAGLAGLFAKRIQVAAAKDAGSRADARARKFRAAKRQPAAGAAAPLSRPPACRSNDEAFNEDARVQLNNLKLQQALVGLNVRQTAVAGGGQGARRRQRSTNCATARTRITRSRRRKQIIDNNSADENAALMNLADQLIQQQDAAVANPAAIRANIPEQGRLLTFKRAVVVDAWADLNIGLEARVIKTAPWPLRLLVLAITALVLGALGLLARNVAKTQPA